ncbi:hypothetical protein BV25DRAFT_1535072 [Artomyces pyxidatus]|uniref:Uncharacterized protein n=1 Tax=Artomyces pyxidatus TaxID=48021 RepID=A0ACB8SKC0_9AGAM|nr:hypothetical protein BV25DRAFT_1535072 [Artomyces pyxidatus]
MTIANTQQIVGLSVFASYFAVNLGLFSAIARSLPTGSGPKTRHGMRYLWTALAAGSFAHTWYYMFSFMTWSFFNFEKESAADTTQPVLVRMGNWLWNTGLFEQAWTIVCAGPQNWWWSEQLCLFTVGSWTVFLLTEGRQRGVKYVWAYMLLGQLVAISVATNLFFLALTLAPPCPPSKLKARASLPAMLWMSVLLSLVTTVFVPLAIQNGYFLSDLLAMHVLLVIPLISPEPLLSWKRLRMETSTLYGLIAFLSLVSRLRTTSSVLHSFPPHTRTSSFAILPSLWATLHSHPAQSSIGWDVVWTTVSFMIWALPSSSRNISGRQIALILSSGVLSIGVVAPTILA